MLPGREDQMKDTVELHNEIRRIENLIYFILVNKSLDISASAASVLTTTVCFSLDDS